MRISAFLIIFFMLGACRFEPILADKTKGPNLIGKIEFSAPRNSTEFQVMGFFEDRFGVPKDPLYQADYSVSITTAPQAISTITGVSRTSYFGVLDVTIRNQSGDILDSLSVDNFTSYSSSGTTFGASAESADAQRRLVRGLVDQAALRIVGFSPDWSK